MENFIKFPVDLEMHEVSRMHGHPKLKKTVTAMHKNWRDLKQSVSIDHHKHHGILTGARNNLTVIDLGDDYDLKQFNTRSTYNTMDVYTPFYGRHVYFLYEEKLKSIYNIIPGVSIINDNRCVFFGEGYKIQNQKTITKMPRDLFDFLYERQLSNPPTLPIDNKCYELLNILSDKWFDDHDFTMMLVCAMRNEMMVEDKRLSTLQCLMESRSDYYSEPMLISDFNIPMNSRQKRFGMCALTKIIKEECTDEYEEWAAKWKKKKTAKPKVKMVCKEGGLTKLADLKANYKGELTAEKLLKMNRSYTICQKNICKSCKSLYILGCCKNYNQKNKTSCQFVNNIVLQ